MEYKPLLHSTRSAKKPPSPTSFPRALTSIMDKPHVKPLLNAFHVLITSYLLFQYFAINQKDNAKFIDTKDKLKTNVWCTGHKHTTRFCRFENLCYRPKTQEWVFLRDENSTIIGIPKDRFDPALAELSSVLDHNLQYFQYVEMPSKTIEELDFNVSFVKKKVLLFNRFHPDNLMHALHDDLLPLYTTTRQIDIPNLQILYMDKKPRQGQYTILYDYLLGDNQMFIRDFNQSGLYCFQEVRVGVNKATTWYQYGFKVPQGPLKKNHTTTASEIKRFRDYMLKRMDITPNDTVLPNKRISVLLTRKHNRLITNQAYVALVVTKANKKRAIVVNQEKYSLKEIIKYVHEAGLAVGIHGSLMALTMFLPNNAAVLEVFPFAINPHYYTPYKTLATLPGMKLSYKAWENKNEKKTTAHPNNPPELGGIAHLPNDIQERIKNSKQVGRHLCCSDPEWLYRAYQDTNVDLKVFGTVVGEVIEERNKQANKVEEVKDQDREINEAINPGKVQNTVCSSKVGGNGTLSVRFVTPWNLAYLNSTDIEYEIWIQQKNDDEVKAYILKANKYDFHLKAKQEYLLWIRCLRNKIQGPFTEAISCKTKA